MMSATHLLSWTARAFGEDITARVFAPLVADWQRDREAATTSWQRVRRDISGTVALGLTLAQVAAQFSTPWGLPARDLTAIGSTFLGYASIGLVVGLAPFVLAPGVFGPMRLAFLAMLAPAMMAVALPVALLPTAAAIERLARGRWYVRAPWLTAATTLVSMVILVAHLGWVVPATNQQFRVRSVTALAGRRADLPRGVKELTLPELISVETPPGVYPVVTASSRRHEAALRVALMTLWPSIFALFGWRLARRRGPHGARSLAGWWLLATVSGLLVSFGASLGEGPYQLPGVVAMAATWLLAALALRRVPDASLIASTPAGSNR